MTNTNNNLDTSAQWAFVHWADDRKDDDWVALSAFFVKIPYQPILSDKYKFGYSGLVSTVRYTKDNFNISWSDYG